MKDALDKQTGATAFEAAHGHYGTPDDQAADEIGEAFSRIAAIEAALAKQRAVNEALLSWAIENEETGGYAPPRILTALREALK